MRKWIMISANDGLKKRIDKAGKKHGFSTRTEFIKHLIMRELENDKN